MKTLLAVARREFLEKRFVLAAAVFVALFPFLVPAVRGMSGGQAQEVRDVTALLLSIALAAAVAAGLGSSMFSGELVARRMGFFYSRPISSLQLWAGKLMGALALVAIAFLVIGVPIALIDHERLGRDDFTVGIPILAGSLLALVLLVNLVSTMIRSRSWVALADVVAALAIASSIIVTGERLRRWHYEPPVALAWVAGIAVGAAFLWSSYRGIERGRTDIRAVHAALSAWLWSALGGATLAFVAYASWVLSAPPSALAPLFPTPVAAQGWVFLEGRVRGAAAGFLLDSRSGKYERICTDDVAASGDGRVVAWVEWGHLAFQPGWTLFTRGLDDPNAIATETRTTFVNRPWPLVLSPDGSLVAAVENGLLSISETRTGRTLASARIGQTTGWRTAWFATPDRVRIVRFAGPGIQGIQSIELDLASHAAPVVHSDPSLDGILSAVSVSGDRLVFRESRRSRITLRDARTLEELATLRDSPLIGYPRARFLPDESIVLAVKDSEGAWLDAFSPAGVRTAHIRLGDTGSMQLGEQPADGRLFLSYDPGSATDSPSGMAQLLVADLRSETVSRVTLGLHPLASGWFWPRTQLARPGSESSRLFLDERAALVRFDLATGERRVLLRGR